MICDDELYACLTNQDVENREAYDYWKQNLQKQGKQPLDMVAFCRELEMNDYADSLEQFICKMEAFSAEPK